MTAKTKRKAGSEKEEQLAVKREDVRAGVREKKEESSGREIEGQR